MSTDPVKNGNNIHNLPMVAQTQPVITADTLNKYLAMTGNSVTKKDQEQFLEVARNFGLNPFLREIYLVSYKNKKTGQVSSNIIVGFEVYLKRAERSGRLDGWRSGTKKDDKGEMSGFVEIYRKDWKHPFYLEVQSKEYAQNNKFWREKPATMIEKVAIGQGFRRCFPVELGGIPYTREELDTMDGDDTPQKKPPQGKPQGKKPDNVKKPGNEKKTETKTEENGPPTIGDFMNGLHKCTTAEELKAFETENRSTWNELFPDKTEENAKIEGLLTRCQRKFK